MTALIGAHRLLCVLNRREFDGPIAHLKKFDESWIKSSLTWGTVPASYKTLTQLSIHLQHSFLQIVLYYVEEAYIDRPARSKARGPALCVCVSGFISRYSTEPIVVWLQKQLQQRRRRRQSEICGGGSGGGGGFGGVFRSSIPYKRGSSQRWRRAR
jgi:hypothetical protein